MEICDYEEIITTNINNICETVLDYVSDMEDGVCQIQIETGELKYCGLSKNESENPLNKCIEVYRFDYNTEKEDVCDCDDECPCYYDYWIETEDCKQCMADNLVIDFKDYFDDIIRGVECQIQEWGYDII